MAGAEVASGIISPIISGIFSAHNTDTTNSTNKYIARQNLAFQRENLDYQKALQQQIFDREDSAYQRTVNDMRAAGMSPLLMSNQDAAGQAVPTEALHNDYQRIPYSDRIADSIEKLGTVYNMVLDAQQKKANIDYTNAQTDNVKEVTFGNQVTNLFNQDTYSSRLNNLDLDLKLKKANIGYTNAQTDSVKEVTLGNQLNRLFNQDTYASRLNSQYLDEYLKYINSQDSSRKEQFNRRFGIFSGMTDSEKKFQIYATLSGLRSYGDFDFNPGHHIGSFTRNKDGSLNFISMEQPNSFAGSNFSEKYNTAYASYLAGADLLDLVKQFIPSLSFGKKKKNDDKNYRDPFNGMEPFELPF